MEIYLHIEDEHITQASFMTDGCGPTIACGSMLTQMITGVSLEAADLITAQDLLTALDGLPPEHVHCAGLAVGTLKEALEMYQAEREET
jgi:nitrogen fixation NifU-like protein